MLRPIATTLVASAAALFLAATASAQSISGTVTSGARPVVGAEVRLGELDRTVRTGAQGEFRFDQIPKGEYHLFIIAPGFASARDSVALTGDSASLAIDLRPAAIRVRDLVVSASPEPRTSDEAYQSVSSKSARDLVNSPGSTFAEKLSDLPGVTVRGNGSAPSRPIIRGLGDNEVLVLENGMRVGDIATYDPAHATPIEASGISQVDVVRGPAAILYGPNTLGGLVNVITNVVPTVSDHPLSGSAQVEGNSVADQYSGSANVVYSTAHSALSVFGAGLHGSDIHIPSGTYTDPGTGGTFQLDRMPQTFDHSDEAGAGYVYQGEFGMLGIGGKRYEMNYGIPGTPPNPNWMTTPPTTSRIAQTRDLLELRGALNLHGSFADQLKLHASYNDYNHSEFPTAQDSTGVSDPQANHFHKQTLNAVLQLRQRQAGKLSGTLGLWTDIEKLSISGDQPLGPNSTTTGLAGYAFEEYAASPRTRFQAGVRYDYNKIQTHPDPSSTDSVFQSSNESRNSNAMTASLGAIQQISPAWTVSLDVARSFRAPTVQELFADGLDAASATYSVGTATLSPEHGTGIDASLRGNYRTVAFEFSPYLNTISNYIFGFLRGDTIQGFPVRQFSATEARLWGFEAAVTVAPAEHFALRASTDYVNAQDTKLDQPLPFIPPLRGLLRGSYQGERWSAMVEERMAARQTRLGDGDTPTDGYAVTNVGVGIRLFQGQAVHEITIHVDNLFNTVYRDNLSVVKDFIPQPGRGVRVGYDVDF
ncbi:MAG TPA: TonB-dependent receptor [Gemmatimonadales bacterium]|nr:TonB-dependent receptor [Gemmatimonadales bacterium]